MNVILGAMFAMIQVPGAIITGEVTIADVLKDSMVMEYFVMILMNVELYFIARVLHLLLIGHLSYFRNILPPKDKDVINLRPVLITKDHTFVLAKKALRNSTMIIARVFQGGFTKSHQAVSHSESLIKF